MNSIARQSAVAAALALFVVMSPVGRRHSEAKAANEGQQHQNATDQTGEATHSAIPSKDFARYGGAKSDGKATSGSGTPENQWPRADLLQLGLLIVTGLYLGTTVAIMFIMLAANRHTKEATDKSLELTRDTFEISNRPYLHVVSFDTPGPAQAGPLYNGAARAILKNTGSGTAHDVMSWPFANRQPSDNVFDVRWFPAKAPTHTTQMFSVGPGEIFGPDWARVYDPIDGPNDGSTTLYFACVVVYRDDFEKYHVYKFSYRYDATKGWVKYRDFREITTLEAMGEPYLKAAIMQHSSKQP